MPHSSENHAFPEAGPSIDAFLQGPAAIQKATQSLKRIARAVLLDDGLAEDVVQDAWVELIERPSERRGTGWLRTLVRSRSIDALRRRSRRSQPLDLEERHLPAGEDELAAQLDVQRKVLEAVEALEEPYRSTVFLRYFEGRGPQEISARLGVAEKTVKNRLTRGHALLRERLAPHFRNEEGRWSIGLLAFSGLAKPPMASPLSVLIATLAMKKTALIVFLAIALMSGWHFSRRSTQDLEGPVRTVSSSTSNPESPEGKEVELSATGSTRSAREVVTTPQTAEDLTAPILGAHGSLRVTVLREDGEPAARVHVVASTHPEKNRRRRRFRETTDEEGVALFPKLPSGSIRLESDRLLKEDPPLCTLQVDKVTESILHLLPGVYVTGRVVDDRRLPVPHAAIWLTANLEGWTGGGIVAKADDAGYFAIEDVPPDQSIGALAPGYRPSDLIDLDTQDKTVRPVRIELSLMPGGTQLSGTVTDESGLPVENALVVVGELAPVAEIREDDSPIEYWTPQATRTDEHGRYRLDSLHPGSTTIQARSIDHALWSGELTLSPEGNNTFDIQLRTSVTVRGRVTYMDGRAAPKAIVMAFGNPLNELYLQGGQVEAPGTLAYPVAIADEEGDFVLTDVDPGDAWLYAMEPRKNRYSFDELVKYAKENLHLSLNTESVWNPILSEGRVIEGHAVYSDGVKIEGVFAILEGEGEEYRGARVGKDGFRFTNLGDGPYTLRIQMWEKPPGKGDPYVEGLFPGGSPVEVVASFPAPVAMAPARVKVRLTDSAERSTGSARVVMARVDRYGNWEGQAENELWEFQLDQPGTYRAVALEEKRVLAQGETFQIQGGEDLELQPLVTQPAGSLVLRIDHPLDHSTEDLIAYVRTAPDGHSEVLSLDDRTELRIDNMEPGPGILTVQGSNVAQIEIDYEVLTGKETVLEVALTPAVAVNYKIRWPISESESNLEVRFTNLLTGLLAYEVELDDLTAMTSPIEWSAMLPLGKYLYEVRMNETLRTSAEFEVTSLDPHLAPSLGED